MLKISHNFFFSRSPSSKIARTWGWETFHIGWSSFILDPHSLQKGLLPPITNSSLHDSWAKLYRYDWPPRSHTIVDSKVWEGGALEGSRVALSKTLCRCWNKGRRVSSLTFSFLSRKHRSTRKCNWKSWGWRRGRDLMQAPLEMLQPPVDGQSAWSQTAPKWT